MNPKKTAKNKLTFDYPITITPDEEDEIYFAEIEDLPGCMGDGKTVAEAIKCVQKSKRLWIEAAKNKGRAIPKPRTDEQFSGRMLLRIPKGLHSKLHRNAQREGVSLNAYMNHLLSQSTAYEETIHFLAECIQTQAQQNKENSPIFEVYDWMPLKITQLDTLARKANEPTDAIPSCDFIFSRTAKSIS